MKVLIVTQYYHPEGAIYPNSIAAELTDRGHEVRVLTGFPNYPQGELYEGFRQSWRAKEVSERGVEVLRVPLYVDHSNNPIRRIMNYLSFGLSSALAYRWSRGIDVIYVYAPQMTAALGPWIWRLMGKTPYVLHIQDLWPDSITGSSLVRRGIVARALDGILRPWIRSVYRHSDAVVGIAPTMVEILTQRGVEPSKAHLVYNWAVNVSEGGHLTHQSKEAGTRILYAGNVGDMQDLDTVIKAAHQAKGEGVFLTIVGDGVALPTLRKLAHGLGCTNVDFVGRVPLEKMKEFYRTSNFSLVCLKDLPNFKGTIPSKFQASLAQGIPVITTVQGDVRLLVKEHGVGYVANAEDVDSLADIFHRAANSTSEERVSMANKARDAYDKLFSLESGMDLLEGILESVSLNEVQAHVVRTQEGSK